jgi:hypothetical protein
VRRPTLTTRRDRAARMRRALEVLQSGSVRVAGDGHSLERTVARLEARIAELEGGRARLD